MSPCFVILWLGLTQVPEPPPSESEVQWSAPPECSGRDALLDGVAVRRGRPLTAGEARVDARVRKVGGRYVLNLAVRAGPRSQRRIFSADTCGPLADATALLITLTVDPAADRPSMLPAGVEATPPGEAPPEDPARALTGTAASDSPGSDPAAPVTGPSPGPGGNDPLGPSPGFSPETGGVSPRGSAPSILPTPEPEARASARAATGTAEASGQPAAAQPGSSRRPGAVLRLQGGPELGSVPGLSAAVGLGLGLLWPRCRLELQGNFVAPRTVLRRQAELQAWLLAASVHACARLGRGRLEVPVCGGLELGGMHGRARGPEVGRAGYGVWVAGVVSAGVVWPVHPRLAVWGALQGLLAVRPSFRLTDPREPVILFEPAPVSGRLLFGLELRLGDRR